MRPSLRSIITRQGAGIIVLFALATPTSSQPEIPRAADRGLASILFLDSSSTIARLGKNPPVTGEHPAFVHARYVNADGTEMLALVFHPGDRSMEVAEAIVERAAPDAAHPRFPGGIDRFESSRGIHLGVVRADVRRILGAPIRETQTTLEYVLDETNAKQWLAEFNRPVYYGTYEFADDRLVKFSFGFEYP